MQNDNHIYATELTSNGKAGSINNYLGTPDQVILDFNNSASNPLQDSWARLFNAETGDEIAKRGVTTGVTYIPNLDDKHHFIAIYHDGKESHQVNYTGLFEDIQVQFPENMEARQAKWAKLFMVETGFYCGEYSKHKPETIIRSPSPSGYSKSELEKIVSDVCGVEYMKHTAMPKALEKTGLLLWMDNEHSTDRARLVRLALSDLYYGNGCLNYKD